MRRTGRISVFCNLNSCSQSGTPCHSSLCNSSSSFFFRFSISADVCKRVPSCQWFLARTFTSSCCWNFRVSHSFVRWRCCRRSKWGRGSRWKTKFDEWYVISCVAMKFLAIFDEMWFLATDLMVTVPKVFAEFSKWENCRCIFKKHYRHEQVQFTDVYRCLFFCWHFAVRCHYHHRIFRIPSRSPIRLRSGSFLADHVQACSGIYHKLSFLGYCGCGRCNPLLRKWFRMQLCLPLWAHRCSSQVPTHLRRAHRSCLAVSPGDLSSNFHGVGTSLMRNFWLEFSQATGPFFFSDVCLTQCRPLVNRTRRIGFQHFCAPPRNRCRIWRLSVLRYTTQLWYTFHNSNCTSVITLFRFFFWLFFNLPVREWALCAELTSRFGASTFQEVFTRRSIEFLRLASASGHFFFSTHFYLVFWGLWLRGWFGFRCRFRTIVTLTHWSPFEHWPFFSPLATNTFFLFQHHLIPSDSWPLHLFRFSHVWRQNFAVEICDLYFFLPLFSTSDNWASIFSSRRDSHDTCRLSGVYSHFVGQRRHRFPMGWDTEVHDPFHVVVEDESTNLSCTE